MYTAYNYTYRNRDRNQVFDISIKKIRLFWSNVVVSLLQALMDTMKAFDNFKNKQKSV